MLEALAMDNICETYGIRPSELYQGSLGSLFFDASVRGVAAEITGRAHKLVADSPGTKVNDPINVAIHQILAEAAAKARRRERSGG